MMARTRELNCRQVRTLMHQFLDGELPHTDHHLVRAHLDVCDACGLEATTIDAVMALLGELQQPTDTKAMARLDAFAARVAAGDVA